ncbi:hypothetical protein HY045_01885 [Candidatus Woesebacteria bacterium]|nr:hypothetical protein [Candidatus Woesebacteria bacterium]
MKKILLVANNKLDSRIRYVSEYLSKKLGSGYGEVLDNYKKVTFYVSRGLVKIKLNNIDVSDFSFVYFITSSKNLSKRVG